MSEDPAEYRVNNNAMIDRKKLKLLNVSDAVQMVLILTHEDDIYVQVKLKNKVCLTVQTTRGPIKYWSTFDTCINWLKQLGIYRIQIDLTQWQSKQNVLKLHNK